MELDVFVCFDEDVSYAGRRAEQEAPDRVQMLVEKAAVNAFNSDQLRWVIHVWPRCCHFRIS